MSIVHHIITITALLLQSCYSAPAVDDQHLENELGDPLLDLIESGGSDLTNGEDVDKRLPPLPMNKRLPSLPWNKKEVSPPLLPWNKRVRKEREEEEILENLLQLIDKENTLEDKRLPDLPWNKRVPSLPWDKRLPPLPMNKRLPSLPLNKRLPPLPLNKRLPPLPMNKRLPPLPLNKRLPSLPWNKRLPALPPNKRLPRLPDNKRKDETFEGRGENDENDLLAEELWSNILNDQSVDVSDLDLTKRLPPLPDNKRSNGQASMQRFLQMFHGMPYQN